MVALRNQYPDRGTDSKPLAAQARLFSEAFQDLVRAYQFRDRRASVPGGLSVAACYVLELLARRGPLLVGEVGQALFLHKSNAGRLVADLAARGLLRPRSDPRDGRRRRLHLTRTGSAAYRRIRDRLRQEHRKLLRPETGAMRQAFTRLVRALHARLLERGGPEGRSVVGQGAGRTVRRC